MADDWEIVTAKAEQGGGGRFLRLQNDGDKAVVAFCGGPHSREVVWTGEKYVPFDPEEHDDKRRSTRFLINVYDLAERRMKIFENSRPWFMDLLKLKGKYGLEKKVFEIERRGNKGDTKTKYGMLPEGDISKELKAEIAAAGLHNLKALDDPEEDDHDAREPETVDEDTARDIMSRLKGHPRSVIDGFLAEFGITRVRDLAAGDLRRAQAWIGKQSAAPVETDPFA